MLFLSVATAGYLQSPVIDMNGMSSDKQKPDNNAIIKGVSIKV
jgi:hypothetical protein